jgi:DNA-binding transcriptional MerR regulator
LPAKFVIKRVRENLSLDEIKDFIRETIKTEREQAVKEERERILKALPEEITEIEYCKYLGTYVQAYNDGHNECLEEVKNDLKKRTT